MQTQWPVIDYIDMIEKIHKAYKVSERTLSAKQCYQLCIDLLMQIPEHGHIFIAQTHLMLAFLADSKDPDSMQTHLQIALNQIRTLLSLPKYASRIHLLNPLDFNRPYADIIVLQQLYSYITHLQYERHIFFSEEKWKFLDNMQGKELFKCEGFDMQVYNFDTRIFEIKRFREPVLPLVMKTDREVGEGKWEMVRGEWRFMCRELMKGSEGRDVRGLGGDYLLRMCGGKGVFEFWGEVRRFLLGGLGYGGVEREGEGGAVVVVWRLVECPRDCECCELQAKLQGRIIAKPCDRVVAFRAVEAAKDDVDGELKFQGYASTSGCGYQWDF